MWRGGREIKIVRRSLVLGVRRALAVRRGKGREGRKEGAGEGGKDRAGIDSPAEGVS